MPSHAREGTSETVGGARAADPAERLREALPRIGAAFGAATATLHVARPDGTLVLIAAYGVPESLQPVIAAVPLGKGIAGAAAAERRPVTICNLQSDVTGVARPRAKQTGVEGAIAVPILDGVDVAGVLGVGKREPHTYTKEEIERLTRLGRDLLPDLRRVADR